MSAIEETPAAGSRHVSLEVSAYSECDLVRYRETYRVGSPLADRFAVWVNDESPFW